MKIAVLGTGIVGKSLALAVARQGHEVIVGTRSPAGEKTQVALAYIGHAAQATTPQAAVASAEVVIIALPWSATLDVLQALSDALVGKIIVDATNAFEWSEDAILAVDYSPGELIQAALPDSHVVKAFNTIGIEHVLDPVFDGGSADMFVAGNSSAAKQIVMQLADNMGFSARDAGPIRNARALEGLAILWIHAAIKGGAGRNVAFALLTK